MKNDTIYFILVTLLFGAAYISLSLLGFLMATEIIGVERTQEFLLSTAEQAFEMFVSSIITGVGFAVGIVFAGFTATLVIIEVIKYKTLRIFREMLEEIEEEED